MSCAPGQVGEDAEDAARDCPRSLLPHPGAEGDHEGEGGG
jgi:hypothetical protein